MPQTSVTFTWDASATKEPDHDGRAFREGHSKWVGEQKDDDGFLCYLHLPTIDAALRLFRLDADSDEAERAFARLCDRHHAIGICSDRFLRYSLLRPQLAWPPAHDLQEFLSLRWTPSDIACVQNLPDPTLKIHRRLRAAAGRLISMPSFLSAVEELRSHWADTPPQFRPNLPLARSSKFASTGCLDLEPASTELAEFNSKFDQFCDEWHLLGMTTWRLPDVRGPQWVPEFAPDEMLRRGDLTLNTPWHFPVLAEDGLGRVLESEHRRQVAERGIDDEGAWETYAKLFEVYHWESILRGRYQPARRMRGFFSDMENLIGDIVGLSRDRVQVLRKKRRALQSGKLKSLRGRR